MHYYCYYCCCCYYSAEEGQSPASKTLLPIRFTPLFFAFPPFRFSMAYCLYCTKQT